MAARKLGDVVRELRERRALTPVDLADRAQVGVSYVTMLEAGQQANPPAAILQRLRARFRCTRPPAPHLIAAGPAHAQTRERRPTEGGSLLRLDGRELPGVVADRAHEGPELLDVWGVVLEPSTTAPVESSTV